MNESNRKFSWFKSAFLLYSIVCLVWFLIRTGRKPSRIAYPCQKAAATQSLMALAAIPYAAKSLAEALAQRLWPSLLKQITLGLFVAGLAFLLSLAFDKLQEMRSRHRLELLRVSLSAESATTVNADAAPAALASPHRVVMVHDSAASSWHKQSADYWNMIDQAVVDEMVYSGLKGLTGTSSVSEAWRVLIPSYQPHQKIAIKVNNNNVGGSSNCGPDVYNRTDSNSRDSNAIIEPANALAKSLLEAFGSSISANDIWVYESYRCFYKSTFMDRAIDGIQFFNAVNDPDMPAEINTIGFSGIGAGSTITFRFDPALTLALNDVVVNADYLINMPIVRKHGAPTWQGSATLSFKNNFGSIEPSGGTTFDAEFHQARFNRTNNCLVDIWNSANIKNKTVLILGDAIIGSAGLNYLPPELWTNRFPLETTPEILFFAVDPVAADSVMADLLLWERGSEDVDATRNYMLEAMDLGLGIAEVGTWTGTDYPDVKISYYNLDFVHINLDAPTIDSDGDGISDESDNCPTVPNPTQSDSDGDGRGDACDTCRYDPENDIDADAVCGNLDNCPTVANANQLDSDDDGLGNACDPCPQDAQNDIDGDGVCGNIDNCPTVSNSNQLNSDGDTLGNACDACPFDAQNDVDKDGVCGNVDNCPSISNPTQLDSDGDGIGDACDTCPGGPDIQANFSFFPGWAEPGDNVQFDDKSSGTITSRLWSFGDGATSNLQNPIHTYSTPGSFIVTLTASGPCGNSARQFGITICNQMNLLKPSNGARILNPPTFSWSPGCNNRYIVQYSYYSDFRDILFSTRLLSTPSVAISAFTWYKVPSGRTIYWRVKGGDIAFSSSVIHTSQEVWSFVKY
jgi:hypothetical protein